MFMLWHAIFFILNRTCTMHAVSFYRECVVTKDIVIHLRPKYNDMHQWKEFPLYGESFIPRNSSLNVLLNLSEKGCSKLYTRMKDSHEHALDNIVTKWKETMDTEMETIRLGRSFMKPHLKYKDTYLKYIQFRTLHNISYTNVNSLKWELKYPIYSALVIK